MQLIKNINLIILAGFTIFGISCNRGGILQQSSESQESLISSIPFEASEKEEIASYFNELQADMICESATDTKTLTTKEVAFEQNDLEILFINNGPTLEGLCYVKISGQQQSTANVEWTTEETGLLYVSNKATIDNGKLKPNFYKTYQVSEQSSTSTDAKAKITLQLPAESIQDANDTLTLDAINLECKADNNELVTGVAQAPVSFVLKPDSAKPIASDIIFILTAENLNNSSQLKCDLSALHTNKNLDLLTNVVLKKEVESNLYTADTQPTLNRKNTEIEIVGVIKPCGQPNPNGGCLDVNKDIIENLNIIKNKEEVLNLKTREATRKTKDVAKPSPKDVVEFKDASIELEILPSTGEIKLIPSQNSEISPITLKIKSITSTTTGATESYKVEASQDYQLNFYPTTGGKDSNNLVIHFKGFQWTFTPVKAKQK